MPLRIVIVMLFIGLALPSTAVQAQTIPTDISKIKSSQLSDAQIIEYFKRFEATGLTQEEGLRYLIQQGLDPTEAENLRKRLADIQSGGKTEKPVTQEGINSSKSIDYSRDTTRSYDKRPVRRASRIFGAELFSNPSLKFEPNIRIATPKGYILGADDQLNVIYTGLNERVVTGKISPDGYFQIPVVGLVYVNGLSIEEATNQIKRRSVRFYPALADGRTTVNVTLGTVRSIRVTIIGEVLVNGQYTISSLSTLFNALYASGGPTNNGSLRNIEIIRANRVIKTVDLYSFIQSGIQSDNVRLQDQDVIRVPGYTKRVAIDGEVRRTGLYELKGAETISDLIKYTGGFSDLAYKGIAKVSQVGEKERSIKDVPESMFDRYILKNADSVYFGAILPRYTNQIHIEGAVYRPGQFELTPGLTLKQLIQKADGLRDDASLQNAYIKRINANLDKEMLSFNLGNVLSGQTVDIPLLREDSVVIISRQDLKENLTVTIGGNVREPGTFEYRKGMSVADALSMSNGFRFEAASHRVEISRMVKDYTDIVSNNLISTITLNLDSANIKTDGRFLLEPLDYIYVPRLVNYRTLGNVKIRGEVLFPGDYPLKRRDETGAEFIARAGGLTPIGSLENAQVFRSGTRVATNLMQIDSKFGKSGIILMEGDSVFIPRKESFVEVAGAVNTPQLLSYAGRSFKYYLDAAGGLTEKARIKSAYVQYPNGTNQPVKKFLFFRNYPPVVAGSRIVVPENQGVKVKLGIGEISAIASALTALVTVIAILVK